MIDELLGEGEVGFRAIIGAAPLKRDQTIAPEWEEPVSAPSLARLH